MPQIIFSPSAIRDLERLRVFLRSKNPAAANRASMAIIKTIQLLEHQPLIGRPCEDFGTGYRELIIGFGDSGYLATYRYIDNIVTILTIRHQKESDQLLS